MIFSLDESQLIPDGVGASCANRQGHQVLTRLSSPWVLYFAEAIICALSVRQHMQETSAQ